MRRAGLAAGAAIGAFALASPVSAAADFQVNSSADAAADSCNPLPAGCTLRDAVNAANTTPGPDTITFASPLSGNTITLTNGAIGIASGDGSATTISGGGTITVSGDANGDNIPNTGDSQIFTVAPTGSATLSGLTLTGGYTAGPVPGAAIVTNGGALTIAGSTISDSKSAIGGGAVADQGTGPGGVTITNSTISGNVASGSGGAIFASKYRALTVSDSTISGNTVNAGNGGGIAAGKYTHLTVSDSTIANNHAASVGGGIDAGGKYAPTQISGSTISGNSAASGGGITFANSSCTPQPPFVSCDSAGPSDSEIENTTISGNHATSGASGGGGLALGFLNQGDAFTVSHSTISGNEAQGGSQGGGISAYSALNGDFELSDSTIYDNSADVGGGIALGYTGVALLPGGIGSVTLDNSTIASNSALTAGGGAYLSSYNVGASSATIPLGSTIVANDSPQDLDRANGVTSGGFNLSFSLVESPGDGIASQASSITGTDPQLGGLGNNGGPTLTQLPSTSSAALDAGNNPLGLPTDQRGDPRTVDLSGANAGDGTDIGAVELGAPPVTPAATPPKKAKKAKKCKKKHKKKHKRSADSSKKKHKKCKKHKKKKRH